LRALQQFAATEVGMSVPIACDIGEGDVAKEIVANARKGPGGLIVMGTHGRSGFERFVLGSVTEKVLRRADCPVLTVPAHAPDSVPVPSGLFSRIVCATDFSDCAMHALTYATSLAQETTAQLTVVHVVELPPEIPVDVHETIGGGPHSLREYVAAVTSERRDRLERAIREHVRTQCAVTTVLASGKPYREILRVAAEQAADLIVVGIQGRGAIDRLFFGSTTAHLVRQASCAVLTIRT
jgi:nucleotide-binding universal stress UspA family protein